MVRFFYLCKWYNIDMKINFIGDKMKNETEEMKECCGGKKDYYNQGGGMVYCLGMIGAAIYYISNAAGFWMGVLGFLKAIIWPVFLVYEVMKFLGM